MKLNQTQILNAKINSQNQQKNDNNISFKSGELISALNFLQTNQAVGATFVDISCMGAPRTAVDFTRGPEAGIETARREFSSTINDALLGAYGVGAAGLLAIGLNKKYGIETNKMFVDSDSIKTLAEFWSKNNSKPKTYLKNILDETKVFNPNNPGCDKEGFVKLDAKTKKEIAERLHTELQSNKNKKFKQEKKAFIEMQNYLKSLLIDSAGTEDGFKIGKCETISSANDYLNNIYKSTKAFMQDKVAETFVKNGKIEENAFFKGMKKLNAGTAILGVAICSAIGAAAQPINMYLTKKKTGNTGFVGGGEENKTSKFKLLKAAIATVAGAGMLATIGKPSQLLKNIQFKGLIPTIPQFKLAFGITIVSRLLAARNENELRESSIKDSLAFVNWLILGGFASKLAAAGFEKTEAFKNDKLIKYLEKSDVKKKSKPARIFNWLTDSSIVSREETLHNSLKKLNIDSFKEIGGKKVAKSFKEILKTVKEAAKAGKPEAVKTMKKMRALSYAQIAGYAYSALVLGIGIPKLNIAITNSVEKKKQQEKSEM